MRRPRRRGPAAAPDLFKPGTLGIGYLRAEDEIVLRMAGHEYRPDWQQAELMSAQLGAFAALSAEAKTREADGDRTAGTAERDAKRAFIAYSIAVGGMNHQGEAIPGWADLPEKQKHGWRIAASVCMGLSRSPLVVVQTRPDPC